MSAKSWLTTNCVVLQCFTHRFHVIGPIRAYAISWPSSQQALEDMQLAGHEVSWTVQRFLWHGHGSATAEECVDFVQPLLPHRGIDVCQRLIGDVRRGDGELDTRA